MIGLLVHRINSTFIDQYDQCLQISFYPHVDSKMLGEWRMEGVGGYNLK